MLMLGVTCFQEEILQAGNAHWSSPDGTWLAYLTINDSLVPKMELPQFLGGNYPASRHFPYPKVSSASILPCKGKRGGRMSAYNSLPMYFQLVCVLHNFLCPISCISWGVGWSSEKYHNEIIIMKICIAC